MKKIFLTILIWFSVFTLLLAQKIALLPIPQKVTYTGLSLRIDKKFNFDKPSSSLPLVQNGIKKFQNFWEKKTLQKVTNLNSQSNDLEVIIENDWKGESNSIEEYQVQIDSKIHLKAKTEIGILHGFETLAQLIQTDSLGYFLPQISISDWPRFEHRGLMIDVARHFIPTDQILRSLDAMAASKMNVLHLHLSDDEGFRIESKKFPLLHQKGSNGEYFTQEEIIKIVEFASNRGIIVVPEFDLPGHSQSWFVGYPNLASEKKEYQIGPRFIIEEGKPFNMMMMSQLINSTPTPTINPTEEKTYQFLETLFKEMSALFPGPYFHIGMDENNGVAWRKNPKIQDFMKRKGIANEHDLQAYFGERLNQIVTKIGKQTLVWEEAYHSNMSKNMVIQLWKPAMMGKVLQSKEVVDNQQQVVISRGFYLDYFMPAYFHLMNPEFLQLKSDKGVLGGEAAIWTELVDKNNFELRIWPRAVAVATRLWSAKEEQQVEDFYDALSSFDLHLTSLGLQHHGQIEGHLKTLLQAELTETDRELFSLLVPSKGLKRLINSMTQPTSKQFSHFEQFADALPSDSFNKWKFRKLIKDYLVDTYNPAKKTTVMLQLRKWASLSDYVKNKSKSSPHLKSIIPLVDQISLCSRMLYDKLNLMNAQPDAQILAEISKLKKMNVADVECVISDELESILAGKLKEIDLKLSLF